MKLGLVVDKCSQGTGSLELEREVRCSINVLWRGMEERLVEIFVFCVCNEISAFQECHSYEALCCSSSADPESSKPPGLARGLVGLLDPS